MKFILWNESSFLIEELSSFKAEKKKIFAKGLQGIKLTLEKYLCNLQKTLKRENVLEERRAKEAVRSLPLFSPCTLVLDYSLCLPLLAFLPRAATDLICIVLKSLKSACVVKGSLQVCPFYPAPKDKC